MGIVRLATAIALLTLGLAGTAQAAQRYASPSGSGEACSQASPCLLKVAIEKAKANDEVIVEPGSYTIGGFIQLPYAATGLDVHGDPAGAPPVLNGPGTGAILSASSDGDRIADLDLRNVGEGASTVACSGKSTVERIRATVSGTMSRGMILSSGCTVRDSLLLASGEYATGLYASLVAGEGSGTARNLTAMATGPESIGIESTFNEIVTPGSFTLDLSNSIVDGAGADLFANQPMIGTGNIRVSHSNYDHPKVQGSAQVTDLGGNQTAPALFADAAAGDYREAAGSPTIDAGAADPSIGGTDLGGSPRVLGNAPDIGAYELPPPPLGRIDSLSVSPKRFRAANFGEAVLSAKRHAKKPVTATVDYALSDAATVAFSVERAIPGRRVGRSCKKPTRANHSHGRCLTYKRLKGGFALSGTKGANSFRFSGRVGGRALKPGSYRLTGSASGATASASFAIVR